VAVAACLFDLDGVLTSTERLHAWAWKQAFDPLLADRRTGSEACRPFDRSADYRRYVDGRPRLEGVRSFLSSRRITLPEGTPGDPPGAETVHGLANAKNALALRAIAECGVDVYPGSVRFLDAASRAGMSTAVVSASANTMAVLEAAGMTGRFDVIVDGVVAARRALAGKPRPDTYLAAATELHVPPGRAAVIEDALAGVEAGRAGGFGLVIGVARGGDRAGLAAHGATLVVDDLAELVSDR